MAKQAGPFYFTGTIGDVIFYKMGESYYIRMKGDYNKKRMQKPGAYPLMHLKQNEFGQASKLASRVYRTLPRKERRKALYNALTREAVQLLRKGKRAEVIVEILTQTLKPATAKVEQAVAPPPIEQQVQQAPMKKKSQNKAKPALSNWQVSAKGMLYKRTAAKNIALPIVSMTPLLAPLAKPCCPCVFRGPTLLLIPRNDGNS
ncbi:MAG TPA: hypothetical protein VD794_15755 [Flavisolibacter sp.]|nr:hypothetical protein [Flavisolibacter sp.]